MKLRLFIVSFSDIACDGRVLRQIKSLAEFFDVTVVGMGNRPTDVLPGVAFEFVSVERRRGWFGKALRLLSYLPGVVFPPADWWPWSFTSEYRLAMAALLAGRYDGILCNDLNAVLLGVEGFRKKGIPFVADYHEFPAAEATERFISRWFKEPHGHRCLKRYGRLAAGSITVNASFAEAFARDYGFNATVVLNAPELSSEQVFPRAPDGFIRLVYHGHASPNRNLDMMIRTLPLLPPAYVLHLMLIGESDYLGHLRDMAEHCAPGRVIFEDPVAPPAIAARVSAFDIGLILPYNTSINNREALPNKLFEYLHAGIGVCCSSSPAMKAFIGEHGVGWIVEDLSTENLARCLLAVTPEDIAFRKAQAASVRGYFHAGAETAKMVSLLQGAVVSGSRNHI